MRQLVFAGLLLGVGNAAADSQALPGAQPAARTVDWSYLPLLVVAQAAPAVPRAVLPAAETLRAQCSVWQILATSKEGGVDPKLASLKSQLAKPPFNSFKTFKLLKDDSLELADRKPGSLKLLTEQLLGLAYMEKLVVEGGRARMRMHLTLAAGGKSVLDTIYAIDEGGTLLQAGQSYQDGTFVTAIACHTK